MKTLTPLFFSLLLLPTFSFAKSVETFESTHSLHCQSKIVYENVWKDCNNLSIITSLDQLNPEAPKEELMNQLADLSRVVTNHSFYCKKATVKIAVDQFPEAQVGLYTDPSTQKVSGAKIESLPEENKIQLSLTLSGFASGTLSTSTLSVSQTPMSADSNIYEAWETDNNGDIEEFRCVVYKTL